MNLYNLENILVFLTLLTAFSPGGDSEKILFLTPLAFKSHKNVFEPLIRELGSRGHNVTVISPMKSSNMPNTVEDIIPTRLEDVTGPMQNAFEARKKGKYHFVTSWNSTFVEVGCHRFYQHPQVKELIANKSFDLIIINGFLNQCAYGLVHILKSPFIIITTMAAPQLLAGYIGHFLPPSFIPSPFTPFTNRMSLKESFINIGVQILIQLANAFSYNPQFEKIYKQYLGQDLPGITEIGRNTSMIFMNSHFSMTYPRPLLPDMIEVGGMHCRQAKKLPKDLDNFLSGSTDGFIYFSMGTIVRPVDMPENIRKMFINVFSRLKERVIWKWDGDMPDLPPNVKIMSFLPQQDILGHQNIKLFITHGGLLSTQEALYHGVPLLGMPMFADQDLNMLQAERRGFCLRLEVVEITEQELEEKMHRLLTEPSFKENAKKLSEVYRDQPQTPLQKAVYWAEYVMRHKGAPQLRSAARELNFFQYHSLDVISLVVLLLVVILYIVRCIFRLITRKLCGSFGKCKPSSKSVAKISKKIN